jgi:hypothetical protein
MQFRGFYPHVALLHLGWSQSPLTIAHEWLHAGVAHLELPPWLEEGLAQMFEHDYAGSAAAYLDPQEIGKNRAYWQKRGLSAFWSGESFRAPGKVQSYSYQMAEVFVRLIFSDHKPGWFGRGKEKRLRLLAFLKYAHHEDAGQAAAQEYFGYRIEDLAARFLGPGDWSPTGYADEESTDH